MNIQTWKYSFFLFFLFFQECFNCPYGTQYFREYAETVPGNSTQTLASAAKENNVFVVGGLYNVILSLFLNAIYRVAQ